ncbi:PHP domain-containing protein [Janibacter sp. GS2]|uniref:PHP domain-containing protein n=1 Tax=Janibacter sp. GS2 TaxID=3442646 RepID=UPI003EBD9E64
MIDLHTHSSRSDGTDTPEDLVAQAAAAGLTTLALTDHDTTAGWSEAAAAAQQHGIALVRGAELSTRHAGGSIHLLAYLFDPDHAELTAEMDRVVHDRLPRLQRIVERMAQDGFDLTWEDVQAQLGTGRRTPSRPNIADALIAKGYAEHRDEIFRRWLHHGSRYYVPYYSIDTVAAIRLVRAAGGVPVLAHPFASRRQRAVAEESLPELVEAGLVGIEAEHRDQNDEERALARRLAREHDLVVTGSSDFHGDGKINRLAENTTAPEALQRIEATASGITPVLR